MGHTLSVVIPARNAARFLGLQLQSFVDQIDPPTPEEMCLEIVVADNGSTDTTAELVQQWRDRLNVSVVDASEFPSVSYARNVGAAAAVGEWLYFCDADDAVGDRFLRYAYQTFLHHDIWQCPAVPVSNTVFEQGLEAVRQEVRSLPEYSEPETVAVDLPWPRVLGGGFGVTRFLYEQLGGGFDPSCDPGGDDNDFSFRVQALGRSAPYLHCSPFPYRQINREQPDFVQIRRRAKSVALVVERNQAWGRAGAPIPAHPLRRLVKSGLVRAVNTVLLRGSAADAIAFHHDLGFFAGYVSYHLLKQRPPTRIGEGYRRHR